MKNILIIGAEAKPIPPVEGGAVELLVDLLLKDNEINRAFDYTMISPYTDEAKKESSNYKHTNFIFIKGLKNPFAHLVDFIDLFNRKFFDYSSGIYYLHRVFEIIRKNDFDLIVVENRPLFGFHIRKIYKGMLVLHLHNDFIHVGSRHLKQMVEPFDRFIVISDYLKRRILEVKSCDIEVVHNGIDLSLYNHQSIQNKTKDIIYAGRLVKEKGVLELINAFHKIQDNSIRLLIAGAYDYGNPNEKEFVKEFEKQASKDDRIILLGCIPNQKIGEYYSTSYLGVVPSVVNEALSLTAIEMLASGLPVIATDAGGLPEVVDKNCGLIVSRDGLEENLYSAINILLNNDDARKKMAECAILKASEFSKENYIRNMFECLNHD